MRQNTHNYDYQKYAILYVNDSINARNYFQSLFGGYFRVFTAQNEQEALAAFEAQSSTIGVVIADQNLPAEKNLGLLSRIGEANHDVIKILSVTYSDIDRAIQSVNQNEIFRFITKPWDITQMEIKLRRTIEFMTIKRERDSLLTDKTQAMGHILISSRLALFALAPLCTGMGCHHGPEAIASFTQCALIGLQTMPPNPPNLKAIDWNGIHERQHEIVQMLEKALSMKMHERATPKQRIDLLTRSLGLVGATDMKTSKDKRSHMILGDNDPLPSCLGCLLGYESDALSKHHAVEVLADWITIYHEGMTIRKEPSEQLSLIIEPSEKGHDKTPVGSQVAKWLLSDHALLSSALGMLHS